MTTFAGALLQIHLDVLDLTNGETTVPDRMDLHLCEDDKTLMVLAHVGDEGIAIAFDPEGESIDTYRAALDAPSRVYRVLDDDEVRSRLDASENATR